jgi:hypothetical protein
MVLEMDESSPRAQSPEGISVTLRPHQCTLLSRCQLLESGAVGIEHFMTLFNGLLSEQYLNPRSNLRTRIGILGDKAGSGKSFVILALVLESLRRRQGLSAEAAAAEEEAGRDTIARSYGDNRIVLTTNDPPRGSELALTVLVVPHSLCRQWEGYIARFGGGLRCMVLSRTKQLPQLRETGALLSTDLVVVTSTFHNEVARHLRGIRVARVVYDEADSIHIPSSANIDARFHWFATASYRNLLCPHGDIVTTHTGYFMHRTAGVRSSGFLRNLFSNMASAQSSRAVTQAVVVKNRDEFVDASMTLPDPQVRLVRCRTPVQIQVLDGFVDAAIINALNAGDVESALQHINPANRSSEESIIGVLMDKMARQLHNTRLQLQLVASSEYDSEAEREADAARASAKCDELERRMQCIRERVTSCDSCCICYQGIENKTVAPCCSNSYCFACINKWIVRNSVCPLCKARLVTNQLLVVTQANEPNEPNEPNESNEPNEPNESNEQNEPDSSEQTRERGQEEAQEQVAEPDLRTSAECDKLENLERILRARCTAPGAAKVLLFSSFGNTFNDIVLVLDRLRIRHRFLRGNPASVAAIDREYRDGNLDVLLVNSTHYGSGLNCENTTDVIMMHKFDTEIERQVLGRAQRCGRTAPLNVWYLLYDNEV